MMNKEHAKRKDNQMRKCIVTGCRANKNNLIRFVISPEKFLVPDLKHKLPGRGIWVTSNKIILEKAIIKNIFSKSAKEKISISSNLIANIEDQLKNQILAYVSLAKKAGKAIFGFEKVRLELVKNTNWLLIQACDGSKRELDRLSGRLRKDSIVTCLNGSELGSVFGRNNVIHCVILNSGFVQKIFFEANRLNNLKNPLRDDIGKDKIGPFKES